jgi:hypothetical protein
MMKPVHKLTVLASRSGFSRIAAFFLFLLPLLSLSTLAFAEVGGSGAGNFTAYAGKVGTGTNNLAALINYVAYIMGILLVVQGIVDLKKHVENPGNTALRHGLIKLVTGGMFLALPFIAGMLQGTMAGTDPFQIIKMNAYTFQKQGANASSVGGLIANGVNNIGVLVKVAGFVGFIIATFLTTRGIQMIRAHVENPGQAPLPDGIKRIVVGGALFSLPMIVNVVYKTFGAQGNVLGNSGWSSNGGTTGGLDGMMVNFISDIVNPAYYGIEIFCYIAGILMVLFAMQRLVRTAQDGPRGPLGFGTIVMFFVAGALLSFPQILSVLNTSLLGGDHASTKVEFMSLAGSVDPAQVQNAKNVFSAVVAFMAVIGFLSVVRGLFLLKSFAEGGQQASMMSVMTHLVAGSIAINLGSFINAVQTSLGVTDFPVTFN